MKDIKIAVIGLGNRGSGLLNSLILPMNRGKVTAVCDLW